MLNKIRPTAKKDEFDNDVVISAIILPWYSVSALLSLYYFMSELKTHISCSSCFYMINVRQITFRHICLLL